MSAITTRRPSGWLRKRTSALLVLGVLAIAIMGAGASSALAASSYNVQECNPATNASAPDLQESGDGAGLEFDVHCASLSGTGWDKGITFHPYSTTAGPRGAYTLFTARPTTYFGSGSFTFEMGSPWFACGSGSDPCWVAYDYVGGAAVVGMTVGPHSGVYGWTNGGPGTNTIEQAVSCQWSFCPHNDSTPWYYDFSAINRLNLTVVDTEAPTLALSSSLFNNQITHGTRNLQIDSTDRGGGVRGGHRRRQRRTGL